MSHDVSSGKLKHIRNFSIIAHIDHGKSTLSDRLIQTCGGLTERELKEQVLDSMDIERERGITIKAQSVTLDYTAADGQVYQLNFIDTPGHVDFSYEVSRSLYACEGALLVVDAAQGVEAQSVANCYTAIEQGLEVLPVLNKIDLPQADPDRVAQEVEEIIGLDATDACQVSAKSGIGIDALLERLVRDIPPPKGDPDAPLQALIVDSWFDNYLALSRWCACLTARCVRATKFASSRLAATGTPRKWVFLPRCAKRPISSVPVKSALSWPVSKRFMGHPWAIPSPTPRPRCAASARFPESEAASLRRYVPCERGRL